MARLTPPLILRPWKMGDEFQPLGMKGKMKVADFLNKKGIPAVQKNQYWVLETRQGIALILGLQIAHWCRVENDTKEVLFIHHQIPPTTE
jgi:tRNA(Ile)-lysidine synthase